MFIFLFLYKMFRLKLNIFLLKNLIITTLIEFNYLFCLDFSIYYYFLQKRLYEYFISCFDIRIKELYNIFLYILFINSFL